MSLCTKMRTRRGEASFLSIGKYRYRQYRLGLHSWFLTEYFAGTQWKSYIFSGSHITNWRLTVSPSSLGCQERSCMRVFVPASDFIQLRDISQGKETMPVIWWTHPTPQTSAQHSPHPTERCQHPHRSGLLCQL